MHTCIYMYTVNQNYCLIGFQISGIHVMCLVSGRGYGFLDKVRQPLHIVYTHTRV